MSKQRDSHSEVVFCRLFGLDVGCYLSSNDVDITEWKFDDLDYYWGQIGARMKILMDFRLKLNQN